MKSSKLILAGLVFLFTLLSLFGCAQVEVKDFKPQVRDDSPPPGPGLLTGKDGYFEILSGGKK